MGRRVAYGGRRGAGGRGSAGRGRLAVGSVGRRIGAESMRIAEIGASRTFSKLVEASIDP